MAGYIAIDLGAGSGRVVRGMVDDAGLSLEEIARFPNEMIEEAGRVYWDLDRMYSEICRALDTKCVDIRPDSIGVDTWGVDFVLLGEDGRSVGRPVAYRDSRTNGMLEKFLERVPKEKIYSKTGIQFMQINTLYQLFAMVEQGAPELGPARDLLMIPDYVNFLLTGEKVSEFTNATTSQIFNITDGCWDTELMEAVGVAPELFRDIVQPGRVLGELSGGVPLIAVGSHDTASAVAAVPASGDDWAYISSGTWSLMGIETKQPVLTEEALACNFTNEGGVGGTVRFLKNIMGLWPVQRLHAEFGGGHSFAELAGMAESAPPFRAFINMDDPRFHNPESMRGAVAGYCCETGQPEPVSPGAFVRCCLESLALQYRVVLEEIRRVSGRAVNKIHVVGGGSKNDLLNRMTAEATGLPVVAGPAEATSMGNILVQAMAMGHIDSIAQGREIIARSEEMTEYEPGCGPGTSTGWDEAFQKYSALRSSVGMT